MTFLLVVMVAMVIGCVADYVTHLWIPQLGAPAIPLMLAILGGIRLGSYIARDKQGTEVDLAAAWATGFVGAGIVLWRHPAAVVLPLLAVLYAWSTLGMHKRHYPHHWSRQDPFQRHADAMQERPWRPLLGGVRPAYRNPDNSNR